MISNNVFSVSNLVSYIKQQLKNDYLLTNITVCGEIGNFTNHYSGHWYFSLKDSNAFINCAMFKSANQKLDFIPENGQQVIVTGSINIFEKSGQLQIVVNSMSLSGVGNFYIQFEKTKQKLAPLGYFDASRKKAIPKYPTSIAVVTGANTAALADIRRTLKNRWPIATLKEEYALVQSDLAVEDIVKALQRADSLNCDVLILARGGGSVDDLWCFNDERIATAIYNLKTPCVTGIGHEIDTTIADLVADKRAATPTAAAVSCSPDFREVLANITTIKNSLKKQINDKINNYNQLLDYYSINLNNISYKFKEKENHINLLTVNLTNQINIVLNRKNQQLTIVTSSINNFIDRENLKINNSYKQLQIYQNNICRQMNLLMEKKEEYYKNQLLLLNNINPLNILLKGYSVTYKDGYIIKSVKELNENDDIEVMYHDGKVKATIKEKDNG